MSLSSLFRCLTTFIIKNLLPTSNPNLHSVTVKVLLRVPKLPVLVKILSIFLQAHYMRGHIIKSPQSLLFSRLNNHNSQIFLIGKVFHPSKYFCGPPLDPVQWVFIFPVLEAPEVSLVLQVRSHNGRGAESPPLTCWSLLLSCSTGYDWLYGL